MPWIAGFIWDEENLGHIARHHVAPEEVEEALAAAPVVLRGVGAQEVVDEAQDNPEVQE